MLDRTSPNLRAVIGGNFPPEEAKPTLIDFAHKAVTAISAWMRDNPVIQDEDAAREGKAQADRANTNLKSLEDERDALVRPLNAQVKAINDRYRTPRTNLEDVRNELVDRLTGYAKALERKRLQEAEAVRKAAAEAAQAVLDAEQREREAHEEARQGVCDIDVAAVTVEANAAFARFEKAAHVAARADRDTKVRLGGGFDRVMTLRNHEVLTVTDWNAAIEEMGLTDDITEAVIKSARAYRKALGELPAGINATNERSL